MNVRISTTQTIGPRNRYQTIARHLETFVLLILTLITAGCCHVVAKCGDAKVVTCMELIRSRDTKTYFLKIPAINIGHIGTNVIHIRNLPDYLTDLFHYSLEMTGQYEWPGSAGLSDKHAPWHDAKVSILFQKADDIEVYRRTCVLGLDGHSLSPGGVGWMAGWSLGAGKYGVDPLQMQAQSFDIILTVEQPSRRKTDQIFVHAYSHYKRNPP